MSITTDFISKLTLHHTEQHARGALLALTPDVLQAVLAILFPVRAAKRCISRSDVEGALAALNHDISRLLRLVPLPVGMTPDTTSQLITKELPQLQEELTEDASAILRGDPAAKSLDEVFLCYPGFFATAVYRFAHIIHKLEVPLLARIITEYAHRETGIDIHPGATIGKRFCIDHGTGIVIGETSEIGDDVKIYQGVTLGGLTVDKALANKKRHPTIEDGVVLYANATILGGDTVVGAHSVIGGNVWITTSIPPRTTVFYKAEYTIKTQSN
jgi:serine O-acetyltransferase